MHIFLNPPNMFWAIEDSDIRLTRGEPFYELSQEEIDELDDEQLKTLNLSLQAQTITRINPEFIPRNKATTTIDFILTRRPSEIQRKYVGRMILAKDRNSLESLLEKESESEKPRVSVVKLLENALKTIGPEFGGHFFSEIEEIEEEVVIDKMVQPNSEQKPRPRKKGPRQMRDSEDNS